MDMILQDLRTALRSLRSNPFLTAAAVLMLALGIGANSAIFTVVNSVLLRPLPYAEPDRLVALFTHETQLGETRNPSSPANFLAWKEQNQVLDRMTAAHPWAPVLTGRDAPRRLQGLRASHELFPLLGAEAALGRTYVPSRRDESHAVVLSHRLWEREFGGRREVIGEAIRLDGDAYTVIGVMPPGFRFPPFWATEAEFWAPLVLTAEDRRNRAAFLRVFARLRPGVELQAARREMEVIAARLQLEFPEANAGIAANLEPLREPVVGDVRPVLWILLGTVATVLLIACANVANLMLARGADRRKEMSLRAALGAGRGRLVRQLLAESALLAMLGSLGGLLLGVWTTELLVRIGPADLPRLHEVGLDLRVFAYTLCLAVATGLLFGLLPALQASRVEIASALRRGGRDTGPSGGNRANRLLVAGEVALAVVLLVGAGLLTRSLQSLQQVDPGFDAAGRADVTIALAGSEHARDQDAFFRLAILRVEALPGVRAAAAVNHLPIGGDTWRTGFWADGLPEPRGDLPRASHRAVTPGYFETMGIPLLRGRSFGPEDRADSRPVVIVNRALARRLWPTEDAVGRRLHAGVSGGPDRMLTVIGITGDVNQTNLTEPAIPEIYYPFSQNPVSWWTTASLVVHTIGDPALLSQPLKAAVWKIDANLPVSDPRLLSAVVAGSMAQRRFETLLLTLFAGLALLLAVVGIYGVVSYGVRRRTREMGLRMALGARRGDILQLVIGQGMAPATLGLILGLVASLGLTRFLSSLLFDVAPTDPATFAAVAASLTAVAALACYLPARRAARVDPMVSLRDD